MSISGNGHKIRSNCVRTSFSPRLILGFLLPELVGRALPGGPSYVINLYLAVKGGVAGPE